ncbi:class V lanthionine synthetase subunit LxmK [Streptomyces sp. CRN 30]|uniref:class V lanthionine synthetase subunit LxmK n=1 Tax=Streptomyces sp. CRN 30 TaxID=3075613 RepID=UPI002A8074AB|nr:class V lanthionine synthetase subunit LxmK [Streptomyces sp. CRN 30]
MAAATITHAPEPAAADRHRLAPTPLDEVPQIRAGMEQLGLPPFAPGDLTGRAGRNDNWAGRTEDGRHLFVKRLDPAAPGAKDRFERVLAFERVQRVRQQAREQLRGQPQKQAQGQVQGQPPGQVQGQPQEQPQGQVPEQQPAWRTPAFLGGDPDTLVLVFACLDGAVTGTALADDGRFDPALAHRAGRALGELHALPADGVPLVDTAATRATANRLASLPLAAYTAASAAELDAWALLQHDRKVREALRLLAERSAETPATPVHGDIRLDQFLLHDGELYLTDWEEFRLADPAADAGGFVGQWLHRAATRMFTELDAEDAGAPAETHRSLVANGERQLDAVKPHIAAFWTGYRAARPHPGSGFAARVTAYAGWHLFDRMLAATPFTHRLGAVQRGIAGVGRNALLDPARFAAVLGLTED